MDLEVNACERYKRHLNTNLKEAEEKSLKFTDAGIGHYNINKIFPESEKDNREESTEGFRKEDNKAVRDDNKAVLISGTTKV